jgi:hypothetical protein
MSPDTADLLSLLSLLMSVSHCRKMSQGQSGLCWFVLQSDMTGPHSTAPLVRQGRDLHCSLAMEARRHPDIFTGHTSRPDAHHLHRSWSRRRFHPNMLQQWLHWKGWNRGEVKVIQTTMSNNLSAHSNPIKSIDSNPELHSYIWETKRIRRVDAQLGPNDFGVLSYRIGMSQARRPSAGNAWLSSSPRPWQGNNKYQL